MSLLRILKDCLLVLAVLGLFAITGACVASAESVVERISFAVSEDGGYVVRIHASEPVAAYSEPRFVSSQQLELILFNAALAPGFHRDAPAGPVQDYVVESRRGHLYLKFRLDSRLAVDADAYRDRSTEDVLLGLHVGMSRGASGATTHTPVVTASSPVITSSASNSVNAAQQRWRLDTIVIDAGHGGHDMGAIGVGGLLEKDVNLAVALRVGRLLEDQLGVNVVYTRQDDRFITLRNRGKIANQLGGKLFVSIHSNASTGSSGYGTETYFLGTSKTDQARSVMERENSVIRLEADPTHYEEFDKQALILQTLAQSAYLRQSEELASLVEGQFTGYMGRKSRGVKQAGFYVLWGASMPAVLIELGFVTNPGEAALLGSVDGQDQLALAIFRALSAFKAQYEKGLDVLQTSD